MKAHKNEQVNFIENIRKGIQNLIKHTRQISTSSCRVLFVRLSANASMQQCAAWANAYFTENPSESIGVILLYQTAVASEKNASFITHCVIPVFGPGFGSWLKPDDATTRRLPNMDVKVGVMLKAPSKKVLQTDKGQMALDDCYTFQRADIYRYYKVGRAPLNMSLANPAPGVMVHAVAEIGGESGAVQMIAPPQADLLLLP